MHTLVRIKLFPLCCNSPTRAQAASLLRFLDHTRLDSKISLNDWLSSHGGRYLQITQQRQKTNSLTLSGIRTHNPSKWADADLSLRPPATGIGVELTYFTCFCSLLHLSFSKSAYRTLEMFIVWEQSIFGNISQNVSNPGVAGLFPVGELAETWKLTFVSISNPH
jgi:hypothetical protein